MQVNHLLDLVESDRIVATDTFGGARPVQGQAVALVHYVELFRLNSKGLVATVDDLNTVLIHLHQLLVDRLFLVHEFALDRFLDGLVDSLLEDACRAFLCWPLERPLKPIQV